MPLLTRADLAEKVKRLKSQGITAKDIIDKAHEKGYQVEGVDRIDPAMAVAGGGGNWSQLDTGQTLAKMVGDVAPGALALTGGALFSETGPGALLAAGIGAGTGDMVRRGLYAAADIGQPGPAAGAQMLRSILPGGQQIPHVMDTTLEGVAGGLEQGAGKVAEDVTRLVGGKVVPALNAMRESRVFNFGKTMMEEGIHRGQRGIGQIRDIIANEIKPELVNILNNSQHQVNVRAAVANAMNKVEQMYTSGSIVPQEIRKKLAKLVAPILGDPANAAGGDVPATRAYAMAKDAGARASSIFKRRWWGNAPPEPGTAADIRKQFYATLNQELKGNLRTNVPEIGPLDDRMSKLLVLSDELAGSSSNSLGRSIRLGTQHGTALGMAGLTGAATHNPTNAVAALLGTEMASSPAVWRTLASRMYRAPFAADILGTEMQNK